MIEARVKSRFPREIGKTSLTGLRTQVIKILAVSYEDIWPIYDHMVAIPLCIKRK